MKDNRIFRVVKSRDRIYYKTRTAISAMFAAGRKRPDILKVEAVDPDALPWADVTAEFRDKPKPNCPYHPTYSGVRKPYIWTGHDQEFIRRHMARCTCWLAYREKHPDYPSHDPLCAVKQTDPAGCPCQVLKKIFD